ncbi:HpcH/HpaI aldolase family protein [Aestuariibius sp. 2305UL40-4]|uniref:HpcH/HpaI aldolase family protein n=1 Tax=Aestuariibius violaceus TaxID=3234132 RepID=UPI00345F0569
MKDSVSSAENLRHRFKSGNALRASWLFLGSPSTTEILSLVGFDFLILDREHSPGDLDTLYHQLRASRVPVIVRVASPDADAIKLALDAGAAGIALSNLASQEDAAALVRATRYTPRGTRGIQRLSRASDYGLGWDSYRRGTGAAPVVIGLIETRGGHHNLDDILTVEGLDCVFVGAVDLACDMGHVDQMDHKEVRDAIRDIEGRVALSTVMLGGLASGAEDAEEKVARGYRLLTFGSDALYLRDGAVAAEKQSRMVLR